MRNTKSTSLGRTRLPAKLANQIHALKTNLRGRTIGFVLLAHTRGLDLNELVKAADELRRLGVLINLSLKVTKGKTVDEAALNSAIEKVNSLFL